MGSNLLPEKLESPLLRLVPRLQQTLQGLLSSRVLLLGNDATLLGLHQILSRQATGGVLRGAVPDLRLRADGLHLLAATEHVVAARAVVHAAAVAHVTTAVVAAAVVVHSTVYPENLI